MKQYAWAAVIGLLLVCGCRSTADLDRQPPPKEHRPRKAEAPARAGRKIGPESEDPAFDLIFRLKPQRHGASIFSEEEQRRLNGNSQSDAAAMRSMRKEEHMLEKKAQKDWVFGTKDGKYF